MQSLWSLLFDPHTIEYFSKGNILKKNKHMFEASFAEGKLKNVLFGRCCSLYIFVTLTGLFCMRLKVIAFVYVVERFLLLLFFIRHIADKI